MDNSLITFENAVVPVPIHEGHRWIPIRHVCEIIDVNYSTQDASIKAHPIYSVASRLVGTRDSRGHVVPMSCLPLTLAISWVIGVRDANRQEGSVEKQLAFAHLLISKLQETYQLVEIVIEMNSYHMDLIRKKEELLNQIENAQGTVKALRNELKQVNDTLHQVLNQQANGQMILPFDRLKRLDTHQ